MTTIQSQIQATVGIKLEVKIAVAVGVGTEEKFHATILTDLRKGRSMLCTDIFLYSILMDVEGVLVIADLLLHTDIRIWEP
jgi:hypothetical protein